MEAGRITKEFQPQAAGSHRPWLTASESPPDVP
jgi:hypothetical protein